MGKKHLWEKSVRHMLKKQTVCIITAAVCIFLCVLTLLEFTVQKLEIEVPVLALLTEGADNAWMKEYQAEEMALDDRSDNEFLNEGGYDETTQQENEGVSNNVLGAGTKPEDTAEPGKRRESGMSGIEQSEKLSGVSETEQREETSGMTGIKQKTEIPESKETAKTESEDTEEIQFPYYIKVNRKQNCITVYTMDDEGEYSVPYKAMTCSTGLYNATPRGTFHLSAKYLWRELYGGVYGQYASRITGGILFHSVPYYKKNKSTLCTDKYNKLGQQASMGCIRLTVEDAMWIAENCPSGTAIEIYDDDNPGPLGKPETLKIDPDHPNKGWDPTDPDTENPWKNISETE